MASTIEIFLCYAREDEGYRQRLEKQLRVFQREELIRVWHDRNISPGEEWEQQVHAHLNTAQIILLLVSPDFMDSDYCYGIEMTEALKRHAEGEARVIPIIVRPVHWDGGPLRKLQALPTDGKPITSASWHSPDDAFHDVADGTRKVIGEFLCIQWLKMGKDHLREQHNEEALAAFAKAIHLAPHYEAAYQAQGDALYDLGRYQDALASYEHVHSVESSIVFKRGQCLFRLRRYEKALAIYDKLLRLNAKDTQAHAYKGYALLLLKRYDEALTACAQARHLDSENNLAYYFACSILIRLHRKSEAYMSYRKAPAQRISDVEISLDAPTYLAKGDALFDQERYEEALSAYVQAHQLAPNDPWICERQGDTLQHQARYDEALSAYEQAIHRDTRNATLYHKKGLVLEQLMQKAYAAARQQGYGYGEVADTPFSLISPQISLSSLTFDNLALVQQLKEHQEPVQSVAISPDGQLVASITPNTITLWELQTETLIGSGQIRREGPEPYQWEHFGSFVAISSDSHIVITGMLTEYDRQYHSSRSSFALWNPHTASRLGQLVCDYTSFPNNPLGAISPDGQIFVGAQSSRFSLWRLHDQELIQIERPGGIVVNFREQGGIQSVAFSLDGQTFVCGDSNSSIRIWDTQTMRSSRILTGHKGAVSALVIAPNGGTLISSSDDKTIKIWNLHSGKLLRTLESRHSKPVQNLIVSSDSQTLLSTGKDTSICLWDIHHGTLLRMIELPQEKQPGIISTAIVTLEGRLLVASIDDKTIKIWSSK